MQKLMPPKGGTTNRSLLRSTMVLLALVCARAALAEQPTSEKTASTFAKLHYRNESWYGSTFWTGPDWTRVGKDWQHPGENTPSVRAFEVPRDGRVTVTGRVYKAHADGDGVRLAVLHDKRIVWQAEIEGKDQQGLEPKLTLEVRRGEMIRFVVHKRGTIFCDTTHWDPIVTYGDGQQFQASTGFSTTRQGENGWHYEMEKGPQTISHSVPGWYYRPGMSFEEMIEADWRHEDGLADTPQSYTAATERQLGLAHRLLTDLRVGRPMTFLAPEAAELGRLSATTTSSEPSQNGLSRSPEGSEPLNRNAKSEESAHLPTEATFLASASGFNSPGTVKDRLEACKRRYLEVRRLKRRIALANPRLDFGKLLFCKQVPASYSHLVMQYFGWRARPGGGLFVLEKPGQSLACRDILDGKLAEGSVLEPRLSYDGKRIVFAYVKCSGNAQDPGRLNNDVDDDFYHIWEVNVDGTGLRQLTSGPYDDLMPTYLPDGGIAFSSTRRKGYARCFGGQFGRRWHVYTLHRMDADGSNLRTLSFHDTNEWFPTVSHTGQILYSRWDYIDRDAVTHQNLWSMRPDGTNPFAVWGNASSTPHCTFQPQPIPGSNKIVFTASAHHSITAGSIAVVDPAVSDNGPQAITRITPSVPFPEAEGNNIREYYSAPWPLSEKYFLVAYSPLPLVWEPNANPANALGIYLLDTFGNRELIYRDLEIGSTNPCPLVSRPSPAVLASALPVEALATGEMILADVYQGLGSVPRGSIKELRIVQILPKTTPMANSPPVGLAGEENGRAILGTVPVEPDGSGRFIVPAGKAILFQAIDESGRAYQTMRTLTYIQPGERVACVGCHENRHSTPLPKDLLAMRRAASRIEPGELGGEPFSFVRAVQPILDKHCVKCHGGQRTEKGLDLRGTPHQGFSRSYWSLCGGRDFSGPGTNPQSAAEALVPRFGMRNQIQVTPPGGMYGARGSRLMRLLAEGHEGVRLSDAELRALAAWIDLNAIFYGVNRPEDQARQLRGESVAMPEVQ